MFFFTVKDAKSITLIQNVVCGRPVDDHNYVSHIKPKKRCLFALFRPTQNCGKSGLLFFFFFDIQFCIFKQNSQNNNFLNAL